MCLWPSMHQWSWAELQPSKAYHASLNNGNSCTVFFIRTQRRPQPGCGMRVNQEILTKNWSWFFFWKNSSVILLSPRMVLLQMIQLSTLTVASAKLLCMRNTLRDTAREREKRNNFRGSNLIHCFVVKVTEVTVLGDLCGTYFFQVHTEKKTKCVHMWAIQLLQCCGQQKPLYIDLHRSTEVKAILDPSGISVSWTTPVMGNPWAQSHSHSTTRSFCL